MKKFTCKHCKKKHIINFILHLRKYHHEIYEKIWPQVWDENNSNHDPKLGYVERVFKENNMMLENFQIELK